MPLVLHAVGVSPLIPQLPFPSMTLRCTYFGSSPSVVRVDVSSSSLCQTLVLPFYISFISSCSINVLGLAFFTVLILNTISCCCPVPYTTYTNYFLTLSCFRYGCLGAMELCLPSVSSRVCHCPISLRRTCLGIPSPPSPVWTDMRLRWLMRPLVRAYVGPRSPFIEYCHQLL